MDRRAQYPQGTGLCQRAGRHDARRGNLTGFPVFETAIASKWVEIFHEAAPHVGRVAFIMVPETPAHIGFLRAAEAAALPLRVKLIALGVHTAAEIERVVSEFAREPNGGLIVAPHAVTVEHRNVILGLAAQHRLPALYSLRNVAQNGGLISYGTNPIDPFRQGASYVDRILKGEKPGDPLLLTQSGHWSSRQSSSQPFHPVVVIGTILVPSLRSIE